MGISTDKYPFDWSNFYREKRYKIDLSINKTADTVTYRQPVIYYFRPDRSNGTEDDMINIINIPLVVSLENAIII